MTTQPTEAVANDANAPVDAKAEALNAFEDIAAEAFPEDEDQPAEADPDEPQEAEPEVDEEAEPEIEIEEEDLPPIDVPVSWDAEAKEAFKELPRNLQETVQKREAERERFINTKAQEAAQSQRTAQIEALKAVEQLKAAAAEQLQSYAKQFEVEAPNAVLMDPTSQHYNPALYAQQLQAHQFYTAQRSKAQQDAEQAKAEQAQYSAARAEHEAQAFRQQLEAELPELLDPANGQQLAKELNATAELLGFDPNQISDVQAIKALKATSEWKAKSDKYDALMKKQMERVRAGKAPPPIAKPGTARSPDQNRAQRAAQAAELMVKGRTRAERDDAAAVWLESNGYL